MNVSMLKATKAVAYLGYVKGHEDAAAGNTDAPKPLGRAAFDAWIADKVPALAPTDDVEVTRSGAIVAALFVLAIAIPIIWKLWSWAVFS